MLKKANHYFLTPLNSVAIVLLLLAASSVLAQTGSLGFYYDFEAETIFDRSGLDNHLIFDGTVIEAVDENMPSLLGQSYLNLDGTPLQINTTNFMKPWDTAYGFSAGFWSNADLLEGSTLMSVAFRFDEQAKVVFLQAGESGYLVSNIAGDEVFALYSQQTADVSNTQQFWQHINFSLQFSDGCYRYGVTNTQYDTDTQQVGGTYQYSSSCLTEFADNDQEIVTQELKAVEVVSLALRPDLSNVDNVYYSPGRLSQGEMQCLGFIGDPLCPFAVAGLPLLGQSGLTLSETTIASSLSIRGQSIVEETAAQEITASFGSTAETEGTLTIQYSGGQNVTVTGLKPTATSVIINAEKQLTAIRRDEDGDDGDSIRYQLNNDDNDDDFEKLTLNIRGTTGTATITVDNSGFRHALQYCANQMRSSADNEPACYSDLNVPQLEPFFSSCQIGNDNPSSVLECVIVQLENSGIDSVAVNTAVENCTTDSCVFFGLPGSLLESATRSSGDADRLVFSVQEPGNESTQYTLPGARGDTPDSLEQRVNNIYRSNGDERYVTETFVGVEGNTTGVDHYVPIIVGGIAVVVPPQPAEKDLVFQFSDGTLKNVGNLNGRASSEVGFNYADIANDIADRENTGDGVSQYANGDIISAVYPSGYNNNQCQRFVGEPVGPSASSSVTVDVNYVASEEGWLVSVSPADQQVELAYTEYQCGTDYIYQSNVCELLDVNCTQASIASCNATGQTYRANIRMANRVSVNIFCPN